MVPPRGRRSAQCDQGARRLFKLQSAIGKLIVWPAVCVTLCFCFKLASSFIVLQGAGHENRFAHRGVKAATAGHGDWVRMATVNTERTETILRFNTAERKTKSTAAKSLAAQLEEDVPWTRRYGFDQAVDWAFAYSSTPAEACTSYVCTVEEGTVPDDLKGTFYKIGPGNFERGGRRYEHVLDGDGFVVAIQFNPTKAQGSVQYTGRFVETEFFRAEERQDKILFRNVFGTQRAGGWLSNAFDLVMKNVANTNVIEWGGRLFALWEAGRPYELDRSSLKVLPLPSSLDNDMIPDPSFNKCSQGPFAQLGPTADFSVRGATIDNGGNIDRTLKFGKAFTAHPHVIDNGETLVGFTSTTEVADSHVALEFLEWDRNWNVLRQNSYRYRGRPPPHDFSLSDDFYFFFQNRFQIEAMSYLLGVKAPTQAIQLTPNSPTLLHVVPRNSHAGEATIIEIPAYLNLHCLPHAFVEPDGSTVTLYSNGWDLSDQQWFPDSRDGISFLGSWGGPYPDFLEGFVPPGFLYRSVFDCSTRRLIRHEQVIPGLVMEFPAQDERRPHIIYCAAANDQGDSLPFTGFAMVDTMTNSAVYWWAENKVFTGEVVPVAKEDGPGSWLITLLHDCDKKRAVVAIIDSERFTNGPVARIPLHHHVTYGLHGSFCPSP